MRLFTCIYALFSSLLAFSADSESWPAKSEKWFNQKLDETQSIKEKGCLTDLKWLIGNWADNTENPTFEAKYSWTDESRIKCVFKGKVDAITQEAIEIIYWDQDEKKICSNCLNSSTGDSNGESGKEYWINYIVFLQLFNYVIDKCTFLILLNVEIIGGLLNDLHCLATACRNHNQHNGYREIIYIKIHQ